DDLAARALDGPAEALAAFWWLRARGLDQPAGPLIERITERWPQAPLFALLEGEFLLRAETGAAPQEDIAKARTRLDRVARLDPALTEAQLWLAKIDVGADRLDEAWKRLNAILESSPDSMPALRMQHEIADQRGWRVEALQLLERALHVSPVDPGLLDLAVAFYGRTGALDALPLFAEQLTRRQLQQPALATYLTAAGRTSEAVAAWRELILGQPTVSLFWEGLVRALADDGRLEEALEELERAETYLPRELWIPSRRASFHARMDGPEAAAADLSRELELQPGRLELRRVISELGASDPLRAHLADARQILADAGEPARGVDSALLADIAAVLIDARGGQTELYQGLHAVYTRAGVEHEGELTVLAGARVESIRLHKRDGRVVDVRPGTRRPVNIPGLAPGDAIEYVWRRYIPPLPSIRGALDNQTLFIFQAPDRDYVLSKYVVLSERELDVEVCGNFDGLELTDRFVGEHRVRSYTARHMPRQRVEPHVADRLEVTPHVRLGMGMTWQDLGDRIRDALVGQLRAAPPIVELADAVRSEARSGEPAALARAMHRVIQNRIRAGGRSLTLGAPASADASAGEGNRVGIALAVSRLLGLEPRLVFARPLEQKGLNLDCPAPGLFGYVLLELPLPEGAVYLDLNDADHPFDSYPQRLSGTDALRVPLDDEPVAIFELPKLDGRTTQDQTATVRLDAGGKVLGELRITLSGQPASTTRNLLEQVTSDRLPLVYNSVASTVFTGATVTGATVDGLRDPESDLTIGLELEGGAWSRRTPLGFAIPMTSQPLQLLSEFAPLESRRHPLMIDLQGFRHDVTRIELTPGVTVTSLPDEAVLENAFGRYRLVATREPGAVVVERTVAIPPQRVEPDDYPSFRAFARAIDEAERHEIQLTVASPSLVR
ncbi:MAG: tetratricopeptide repeat protein, partial [Acidobacteriota bacterium]|nr:tetratricopeptide repeat protein [Acidobacteriota bacterium]